jgi:hypothetical protein
MDELVACLDRSIDEVLISLGTMVLRLSDPDLTRTAEQRRALARSVRQFACCANRSRDPRVLRLAAQLQDALKPRLRLVAGC